jgi:hypothetical protein
MKRLLLSLIPFLLLAAGCERRERFASPDTSNVRPTPEPPARSAYLSVSELSPDVGAEVIVAGTVTVDKDLSLGSFRVRLGYDSTMLRFVDEIPSAGMMRVVNARSGEIVIVGASSASSTDGRLFVLRFTVGNPEGLNSLVLRIDELNDAAYLDQKRTVVRAARLVRDSSLAGGKGPR